MKLYTEEEVMKLMLSMKTYIESHNLIFQVQLEQLNPIELPSYEEIEKNGYHDKEHNDIFREGAKYVIDKIQGGNNEQQ